MKSTIAVMATRARYRSSKQARYTYAIMKPEMSHDLVKDFTSKIAEHNLTVGIDEFVQRALKI